MTHSEREAFRTEAGKRVPPHHWAVYDLIRTIPAGRVSTYKDVCAALGQGSPRSVGGALRNNPFAPRIPCHRVIASSLFVGGFKGEWGAAASSVAREHSDEDEDEDGAAKFRNWHKPFRGGGMGPLQNEKVRMLVCEGVGFGKGGKMMIRPETVLWQFDGDGEE
jgi:methylated-DNA-[protein]-cysteine S-methyltransferase